LQAAGRYQTASCNTFLFSRIFSILHAVSNTFWFFAKRRQTTFKTETKGNTVTFPNSVTQVILLIDILNSSLLVTLSVKSSQRIMFHKLVKLLVRIRAPAAKLPAESANCMQRRSCLAIPLGELKGTWQRGGFSGVFAEIGSA
jgi:hypothetical protein